MICDSTRSDCQYWVYGLSTHACRAKAEQKSGTKLCEPGHFESSLWAARELRWRGFFCRLRGWRTNDLPAVAPADLICLLSIRRSGRPTQWFLGKPTSRGRRVTSDTL